MLTYTRVDAQCIPLIRPFFDHQSYHSCDYTAGVVYMWRNMFHAEYAIENDMLYLRMRSLSGLPYHLIPVGTGNIAAALTHLFPDDQGILRFSAVPGETLDLLRQVYGDDIQITEERRWADYLYEREALATYRGKKLAGQRNHVNRFLKDHGSFIYEPLTLENLPAARAFLLDKQDELCHNHPIARAEYSYMLDLMTQFDALDLLGGILRLPTGDIAGVSMGTKVGDTLYVHAEKALRSVNGASQLLCREFAAHAPEGVQYINREDDMGEEGLRTAKLALHPCALIAKYTVTVNLGR